MRIIFGAVDIVAAEAGDAAPVHYTLHEIVALHAVFVRGAIGEVCEGGLAESVLFQLPKIAEVQAHVIANGSGRPWEWHWMQESFAST